MSQKCDVLILGAGVVGLSIGISLLKSRSNLKIIIAEKESSIGRHASGRNSGVLHAGFYYSPDSLKAKFCKEGNFELRKLAKNHKIEVREVGKVVVTQNEIETKRLSALYERGIKNGVEVEIKDASELQKFEPLAVTHNSFLWSPTTAVSNPKQIIEALLKDFLSLGGRIDIDRNVSLSNLGEEIYDDSNQYRAKFFVNAAGAQADKISRKVGVGTEYAMVPFIGMYRTTEESNLPLRRLVYPVPHPINPFLGVHFTLTIDKKVKIGPTAIPIFGREQYSLFDGWSSSDLIQSLKGIKSLVNGDAHDFGSILKSEWPKVIQPFLIRKSAELVPSVLSVNKWSRKPPGIRAQLIHLPSGLLEQDFVVRSSGNATHVLNAVSPGWTSALPFGRFIASEYILPKLC